jgi:glycosyltransferase involved in cell wall biosynthesis
MIRTVQTETLYEAVRDEPPHADLVTVAISLFNYAHFLPEALETVAAQKHPQLDLIIVDDVSEKDDSVGVAAAWLKQNQGRFARVLLLQHQHNQGLAQSRNTAFTHARTARVFVMDADNALYPRAIGRLLQAIKTSGAAAVYCHVWQTDWLKTGNYIDAMALVSSRAWRDVGGYSHIEGGWEDYDFWCKFVEQGYEAAFVPEMLCRYRVHNTSMLRTESARSYDSMFIEMTLRHPWMELAPIPPELKLP